jgi:hypothetical protein
LRDIAESQAIAGEIPMALGTVAMIERDFEKGEGFRRVAYAQADAGDATNALSWGATQGRSLSNGYALLGIAEGLLERVRPSPARFGYWWRSGDRSHHDLAGRRALALCSRK